jgi:hypothetical protein
MSAWARSFSLGRSRTDANDMPEVDPDDDDIRRWVVRHYAHDSDRHERRHQVVAAFDNEAEFLRLLEMLNDDLKRRRDAGDPVDRSEHFTGQMLEPGHRRRAQDGRLLMRLIRHRARISDELVARLELPHGMSVLRSRSERDR